MFSFTGPSCSLKGGKRGRGWQKGATRGSEQRMAKKATRMSLVLRLDLHFSVSSFLEFRMFLITSPRCSEMRPRMAKMGRRWQEWAADGKGGYGWPIKCRGWLKRGLEAIKVGDSGLACLGDWSKPRMAKQGPRVA
jgi:hypothetical protein